MNGKQRDQLRQELSTAGASASEARALVAIAGQLSYLGTQPDTSSLGSAAKRRIAHGPQSFRFVTASLVGLMLILGLTVIAQTAMPGSALYPVQKVSDQVAVAIAPSYRASVMMKRASQVKQLVAERADTSTIQATLADYRTETAAYKKRGSNYEVLETCKHYLQQAAALAPPQERQAINATLVSLSDT